MAETAARTPPPAPPPATRTKLSGGLEPLDARIKELTSSQGELLARIQKLKQEVQNWRSNVEAQVKTCHNELVEVKEGLASEVQHLRSDIKEIRSALQEEKAGSKTEQTGQTQEDQVLKTDDEKTEQQTAVKA